MGERWVVALVLALALVVSPTLGAVFVQDNNDFGGAGPLTAAALAGHTLQGTGHTVSGTGAELFNAITFDANGVTGTPILTAAGTATNLTFAGCTFSAGGDALVLSGPPAGWALDVHACAFQTLAGESVAATGLSALRLATNTFADAAPAGGGAVVRVSTRTGTLGTVEVWGNAITHATPPAYAANTAGVFFDGVDTTVSSFDVYDNAVSGVPVGIRVDGVEDPVVLNNLPASNVITIEDDRTKLRELAKRNPAATGSFHDLVDGPAAADGGLVPADFCDDLCNDFTFNAGPDAPVVAEDRDAFKFVPFVTNGENERALSLAGGGEVVVFTVPPCVDNRPCGYLDADLRDDFTVELRVRPLSIVGTQTLVDKDALRVYVVNGQVYADVAVDGTPHALVSTAVLTPGTWGHVAVRRDATTGQIDLLHDGVTVATAAGAAAPAQVDDHAATQLHLGARALSFAESFLGAVDELRVWRTARTDAEIADNAARYVPQAAAGLQLLHSFSRLGHEPAAEAHDASPHAIDGLLTNVASPAAAYVAQDPAFGSAQFKFVLLTNAVLDEAGTVDFFPYDDVRHPGSCASRAPLHDLVDVATDGWFDIWNPVTPAFVGTQTNQLHPESAWSGRETSAPLNVGSDLAAGLPGDYEPAVLYFVYLTLQELEACRDNPFTPLMTGGSPLTDFTDPTGSPGKRGRLYFTATTATDQQMEAAGERVRRSADVQFTITFTEDYGTLASMSTSVFDFAVYVEHIERSIVDGELEVTVGTYINHIEQLYEGHESSGLFDGEVQPVAGETGPPLLFLDGHTNCTEPDRRTAYTDRFFASAVDVRWGGAPVAPSVEPAQCVLPTTTTPQAQFLRVPNGQDVLLTLQGLPAHDRVEIAGRLVAVGGWTGDAASGELARMSVDGHGLLFSSTVSTSAAQTHSFPNSAGGGSAIPLPGEIGTLCMAPGPDGVFEMAPTVLPHRGDTLTLRLRTVGVVDPGQYMGVDDLQVVTFTDTGDRCYQRYTLRTTGHSETTDFTGAHPLRWKVAVFDPELGTRTRRGNETFMEAALAIDAHFARGWSESEDVEARVFTPVTPQTYADAALAHRVAGFVYGERVYTDLRLDLPAAERYDHRVVLDTVRTCVATSGLDPAPYDREAPESTGCNTPNIGLVAFDLWSRADPGVGDPAGFAARLVGYPPLQASSEVGISFMSNPLVSAGHPVHVELRFNVTAQPAYLFERAGVPNFDIPREQTIQIAGDGTLTLDADGAELVAFVHGRPTYHVSATDPGGSPYTGPAHQAAATGDVVTGVPGTAGAILTLVSTQAIATTPPLTLNSALVLNTFATSYMEAAAPALPTELAGATLEFRLKLFAAPGPTDDITVVEVTATAGADPLTMGCRVLGGVAGSTLECWREYGTAGHAVRTAAALQLPGAANELTHYAFVTRVHGSAVEGVIYIGGTPAPTQDVVATGPAVPTAAWHWPAGIAATVRAGVTGPGGALLDELRVWAEGRDETQVAARYNHVIATPAAEPTLWALYPFDDGATPFVHDVSAFGHHGLLVNGNADPAEATTYRQHAHPEGFFGYGTTADGPDLPGTFDGNYALELKAGSGTGTGLEPLQQSPGAPELTVEFLLRVPDGVAAYGVPTDILTVRDTATGGADWKVAVELSAAGLTVRRYSPGPVLDAATLLPAALIPASPADPDGADLRLNKFAFRFRQIGSGPAVHGWEVLVNGALVPGAAVLTTVPTAAVPGVPAATGFDLVLASAAAHTAYLDEVALWTYARSDAQEEQAVGRRHTGTEPGLAHYYQMQDPAGAPTAVVDSAVGGVAPAAPLGLAGQAQKSAQNMRPEWTATGYDHWGASALPIYLHGRAGRRPNAWERLAGVTARGALRAPVAAAVTTVGSTPPVSGEAGGEGQFTVRCGTAFVFEPTGRTCRAVPLEAVDVSRSHTTLGGGDSADGDGGGAVGWWAALVVVLLIVMVVFIVLVIHCVVRHVRHHAEDAHHENLHVVHHTARVGADPSTGTTSAQRRRAQRLRDRRVLLADPRPDRTLSFGALSRFDEYDVFEIDDTAHEIQGSIHAYPAAAAHTRNGPM